MNKLFMKNHEDEENRILVFFLGCFFAPLWGVGYILPFLIPFFLFLISGYFSKSRKNITLKSFLNAECFVFLFFLFLVLFSSFYHDESKWGSTEGFWVTFASFLFFTFGAAVGIIIKPEKLAFYLKLYFFMGFFLLVLTITNFKTFRGGVFDNLNDLTSAVLMLNGAICGIFFTGMDGLKKMAISALVLPFIGFAFYFSINISSSDAAVPLLIGLLVFYSILIPSERSFAVFWSFFLLLICVGVVLLIIGEPLNFKALFSVKKLESFLSFRPQGWFASLSIIRENPWMGIGSGQYKQFYEALLPLLPGKKLILSHSHSVYFTHFVSHGVAAGLAFITLLVLNLRLIFSALKDPELVAFGLMVGGIWFFFLTYGLVELSPASRELIPLVWGSSGLLVGLRVSKRTGFSGREGWRL